ncbi:MAG: ComEC/Rec2 family competence protein [Rhodoplanes sp.]
MAEPWRPRDRAGTWPVDRRTGRRALPFPGGANALADAAVAQLREWAVAETSPGRFFPWLAVAFAFGIVLYFAAEREPALWAAGAAAVLSAFIVAATRGRGYSALIALGFAALAAGFFLATLRAHRVDHPILRQTVFGAALSGYVELREERERSDRVVLRVHSFEGARTAEKPERVRVAVRKGTAPPVGAFVTLKARLSPPLAPLRPGGYDFARDLYFHGIGAVGFALGAIRPAPAPAPPDLWVRGAAVIDQMREAIDQRIRAVLSGDARAIASALITGKRDAISSTVNDAMYVSSLAHVLSISGYHMAVVAGVVFIVVRAFLALAPALAERRPIKKWAAVAALLAAASYLVLSGAEVATQRAFIMTAIVLLGVMLDRQALTLRTLAVAALAVMVVTPEAVVHPSFQMSFAATLALVAAYERGIPWIAAGGKTSLGARLALWGGRELIALVFASLVAGLATTLFAAYHFHRLAPYGVLANLLAMPVVSGFVMPAGLLALIAMPFGFDAPVWRLMGYGIDWMTAVALWVASLPGAVGRIPAFGIAPMLIGTLGLIVICLLRTPLRWSGVALLALAAAFAAAAPRPDVLISGDGEAVAVRRADGRFAVLKSASQSFAPRDWLGADGDARGEKDPDLASGFICDPVGCIARLADGTIVAVALTAEAFADDCVRAALVVARRDPPADCAATVVDRERLRTSGALALRRLGQGWEITPTRPPGYDRPWAKAATETRTQTPATHGPRPTPRDATPAVEDLEPGDANAPTRE